MGVALVIILSWSATSGSSSLFVLSPSQEALLMRKIGDQVLRHTGDSSSRVLPVQEKGHHSYLLSFDAPFTFIPDSLVAVIDRVVKNSPLPPTYVVEVVNCRLDQVIFGFSIDPDTTRNIVPCRGRLQEKACYRIRLTFHEEASATPLSQGLLMGSSIAIALSLLVRFWYTRQRRQASTPFVADSAGLSALPSPQPVEPQTAQPVTATVPLNAIAIGSFLFYKDSQLLVWGEEKIPLTAKEASVLLIFAVAQNEVVDRDRLMKEVWEDEGVIVGRSLDMFVSKLRKKLQQDPHVSILNVHGKGYKLVVESVG